MYMGKLSDIDKLRDAVHRSISIAGVLKKLELSISTGNYRLFKRYVKKHNIDCSHFLGQSSSRGVPNNRAYTLDTILVENSEYTAIARLKKRLVQENLLQYKCAICGIFAWQDKPICLQLDHINGICNDHRLINLRLLCPNCHSQTNTFAGRNKK